MSIIAFALLLGYLCNLSANDMNRKTQWMYEAVQCKEKEQGCNFEYRVSYLLEATMKDSRTL